jgi:methylated-DNA-protein-cysteine methyltransferase-like protein
VAKAPKKKALKKKKATLPPVASNPSFEAIYRAVERIPRGRVSSYGAIAHVAGLPRRARLVGTALKSAPTNRGVPWHRVLTSSGKLAFPENSDAFAKQRARLAREGVPMIGRRVDLHRYGWPSESKSLDELLWGGA